MARNELRTLARWVSNILQKAGIHTKIFTANSDHSVWTSTAFSVGLSFTGIEMAAGWRNGKTFGKLYNRLVIDKNFGKFLLTNSL